MIKITNNPYLNEIIDDYYQYYYKLSQIKFPIIIMQYDCERMFYDSCFGGFIIAEFKNINELTKGIYNDDINKTFILNSDYDRSIFDEEQGCYEELNEIYNKYYINNKLGKYCEVYDCEGNDTILIKEKFKSLLEFIDFLSDNKYYEIEHNSNVICFTEHIGIYYDYLKLQSLDIIDALKYINDMEFYCDKLMCFMTLKVK